MSAGCAILLQLLSYHPKLHLSVTCQQVTEWLPEDFIRGRGKKTVAF